ncbi:MAG: DUF4062 domain-containing protein, partial [bacterium]|nr:DUF4062 domain-containing protein [bacterium]
MTVTISRLSVFVGSPSDCEPERVIVRDLIQDVNTELKVLDIPIEFDVVCWKDGVFPDIGRPQGIINEKVDQADIVLIIFWHRFGTDAGRNMTGTEEEFHRALERRHRKGKPRVLLYFKENPPPYDVDVHQLTRLREFRRELE